MNPQDLRKEYTNGELTIIWQSGKCTHSANCVKHLSKVFKPKEKPWIQIENGSNQEITDAVSKCPSGALSIKS